MKTITLIRKINDDIEEILYEGDFFKIGLKYTECNLELNVVNEGVLISFDSINLHKFSNLCLQLFKQNMDQKIIIYKHGEYTQDELNCLSILGIYSVVNLLEYETSKIKALSIKNMYLNAPSKIEFLNKNTVNIFHENDNIEQNLKCNINEEKIKPINENDLVFYFDNTKYAFFDLIKYYISVNPNSDFTLRRITNLEDVIAVYKRGESTTINFCSDLDIAKTTNATIIIDALDILDPDFHKLKLPKQTKLLLVAQNNVSSELSKLMKNFNYEYEILELTTKEIFNFSIKNSSISQSQLNNISNIFNLSLGVIKKEKI